MSNGLCKIMLPECTICSVITILDLASNVDPAIWNKHTVQFKISLSRVYVFAYIHDSTYPGVSRI